MRSSHELPIPEDSLPGDMQRALLDPFYELLDEEGLGVDVFDFGEDDYLDIEDELEANADEQLDEFLANARKEAEAAGDGYLVSSLDAYIQKIRKIKLLSRDEEIALAQRIETGDTPARQQLIESNIRLVAFMAKKHAFKGLPLVDLIQEGSIGLMTAADKFDWRRGNRFSTVAGWWIMKEMKQAIDDKSQTIRLPGHVHARITSIHWAENQLLAELQRYPTSQEVMERTGLSQPHYLEAISADNHKPLSLEQPVRSDIEFSNGLGDYVTGLEPGQDPVDTEYLDPLNATVEQQALNLAMRGLDQKDRAVITSYFGLDDGEEETLESIGASLGFNKQRALQRKNRALKDMAHNRSLRRAWSENPNLLMSKPAGEPEDLAA